MTASRGGPATCQVTAKDSHGPHWGPPTPRAFVGMTPPGAIGAPPFSQLPPADTLVPMSAPRGGHRFRTVATVYGQILTVSVVAALSEDAQAGPSEIFESVVLTMTVIAGRRAPDGSSAPRRDLRGRGLAMVRFLETPVCQGQREHHADGRRWQGAARYRLNAARLANCGARSAVAHFQWAQVRQVESDTPGCLIALS